MNFPLWDFSTPSNMFNFSTNGPFPSNVSAYFRRPSKIVKPSSRNNSPRTSSRRRMTTTGHNVQARTRSVVDYQRSSMPHLSDNQALMSRPVSWHPNMLEAAHLFQYPSDGMMDSFMPTPYTTAEINGLVTPMSYPMVDEPQIQELITPLEGLSANEAETGYGYGQDFDMTQYWLSGQTKDSVIDYEPSLYPTMDYPPQSQWLPTNQYMMPNVSTTPASPSFLPMPDFGAPLDVVAPVPVQDAEELVGMGLYDSPAEVQSSSLLFGTNQGVPTRRGLKLEDSFEPSLYDDEDDEDDEDEDDKEDGVASEEDDFNEPGVSPTDIACLHQQQPMAAATHAPTLYDNYIIDQWQMPVVQGGYGWI